jgi:diacylglycerol O-acyltransferase / wax synthase
VTPEHLTAEDARILALESGTVRGHMCKVLVIGCEHGAQEVRDHLAPGLAAWPRLTRRLAPSPGAPALVDDPDFALERHVVARGTADDAGLRRLVAAAMSEPLDREHPLWAMDVVALSGGRTALVWRIHHAIADGMAAMRMASELLFEPAGRAPGAAAAARPARPAPAPAAGRMPATVWRQLGRRGARSPLDRPAGPRREVAFVDAELDDVRRIAHDAPVRATVNDVVLAAVAAGLRAWLERVGAPEEGLRVKVPVSLHTAAEGDVANRDSFMIVDLPVSPRDPLERLCAVARETRACKAQHDAQTLDAFFRDLTHLSRSLERFAQHWAMSPRVFTLNVSNVPGPSEAQTVLGSPLLELHSLAEIAHHHALRVACISAAGRISFGLCADPDAVDGLAVIAGGIESELDALGAAVGDP